MPANYADVVELMRGHDATISCVNYWYNEHLSQAAIETEIELLRSRRKQLRRR